MSDMTLEQYQTLVEQQSRALLAAIQAVARGDLDTQIEIPEGIKGLSDLAVGLGTLLEEIRAMMAHQVQADLVEKQSQALLDVVQSVALGNLDVEVEVPEGVEILSELAIGMEMMIDDLRETQREQEQATAELERSRQRLEAALAEVLAVQQRYVQDQWQEYVTTGKRGRGYFHSSGEEGLTDDMWLPAMTKAVQQGRTVIESDPGTGTTLAVPVKLYGQVIGAVGFDREGAASWNEDEVAAVQTIVEQMGWALESQRLFDEEQQARSLMAMRVSELDCLSDVGRKIDEAPPVAEFLQWVAERIPSAMRYPELCVTSIRFNDHVYGTAGGSELPRHIVQSLYLGDERVGQICIAYKEEREFVDEESALLGDIARRVGGYIENRRLLQETQRAARELAQEQTLLRTLIDSIPDYVFVKDAESRFVVNNAAHLRVLGAETQQEILGKTDFDIFPPELAKQYYADEQTIIQSGEPVDSREEPTVTPDGTRQWLLTTKVPLHDSEGTVTGLVGISRDITGLKESEQVLERRRAQLECLSDIGRKIGEFPSIPEFLQWLVERIPSATQYSDICLTAAEFEGRVYGEPEALESPYQMVQSLRIGDERMGRLTIAYSEPRDFLDEESALLGDIARRANGYIDNRRLLRQTQLQADEQAALRRITEAVSRSLEMQELLDVALERVLGAMNFDAGLVSLYEEDTKQLVLAAHSDVPEPMVSKFERDGLGGTLCEYVFDTGETIGIDDVRQGAPVDVSGIIRNGLLTYAGAPLEHAGRRVGTVCFFHRSVRELTERELTLLESIGRQISVGIANVRLLEQTRKALAEVEATHRSYLRREWQEHLRQRRMLERSGFLYDRSQAERPEDAVAAPGIWRPEIQQALAEGSVAIAHEGDGEGERAGLAMPITVRGQTIGVLGVETPGGDRQWTEDDRALIQAISDQLGQTLETARLFADTQRRAERERLIGEISAKIRASTDMRDILETAATELGQVLGTSRTSVRVGFEGLDVGRGSDVPGPAETLAEQSASSNDGRE